MSTTTTKFDVGDRGRLSTPLQDEAGNDVQVTGTGAAMRLTLLRPDGTVTDATANVSYDATAKVYTALVDFNQAGEWRYKWQAVGTYAGVDQGAILVRDDPFSPNAPPTSEFVAWCGVQDVYDLDPSLSEYADVGVWCQVATDSLYRLSGGKFPGLQTAIVRPMADDGACPGWQHIENTNTWIGGGWGWGGGQWLGGCGCGCGHKSRVRLSGYVRSITRVTIDGVVIPASAYHVEDHVWLVRDDAAYWPACQDLGADVDTLGSFCVTYTWGESLPAMAGEAAAEFAVNLTRQRHGLKNNLPTDWTTITRQGLTISRSAGGAAAAKGGSTGMAMVDLFLATYNPTGRRRPPTVWSPDVAPYGRNVI